MEKGLNVNEKIKLLKDLRTKWSLDNIKNMKIEQYSKCGSKDTFTYNLENGSFKDVCSIKGAPSFVFCIYSHSSKPSPKENRHYDDEYSWYKKYGNDRDEAWKNIRQVLINLIQNCKDNETSDNFDWVLNRNSILGQDPDNITNFKKAIIFMYQKSNINETTLVPIFNNEILQYYFDYNNLKPNSKDYYDLQKFLINKYKINNIKEAIEKSEEIWKLWENRTVRFSTKKGEEILIFKQEILDYYIKYRNLKPSEKDYYNIQKFLIEYYEIRNINDAIKKSEEILGLWENRTIRFSTKKGEEIPIKERKRLEGAIQESLVNSYKRNSKTVAECKERDNYSCQSCNFSFKQKIVEAHHLEPLYLTGETEIGKDDLITLCPTCHKVAHYLLGKDENLITREKLIPEIKIILEKAYK